MNRHNHGAFPCCDTRNRGFLPDENRSVTGTRHRQTRQINENRGTRRKKRAAAVFALLYRYYTRSLGRSVIRRYRLVDRRITSARGRPGSIVEIEQSPSIGSTLVAPPRLCNWFAANSAEINREISVVIYALSCYPIAPLVCLLPIYKLLN